MSLPFVGREPEIARLTALLDGVLAGQGQCCFVAGEAGAGKSTLIRALTEGAEGRDPDLIFAIGACNAQTGIGDPYLPFLDLLNQLTGNVETRLRQGSLSERSASRLRRIAQVSAGLLLEVGPDLIGTFIPSSSLIAGVAKSVAEKTGMLDRLKMQLDGATGATSVDQQRIIESYTAILRRLAAKFPLVIVLDDLQWADAASCLLFFHLAKTLEDARILLIGTYRPHDVALGRGGERHPLASVLTELKRYRGNIVVDLDAAGDAQRRAFVSALIDSEPNHLDAAFRERLYAHTRGHALFTVELLRTLQERECIVRDDRGVWTAAPGLDWTILPSRVEGVIEERIGRLESELRDVLRTASVEGESFTVEVVAHIGKISERSLLKTLSQELQKRHQLVTEGDVLKIGRSYISHYLFAHALFQQYLYNGLSRREKMILHGEVAELLEQLYAGQLELVTVQLAHHYRIAGEDQKAYEYSMRAARHALRLGACSEALANAGEALAVLAGFPDADRGSAEIDALLVCAQACVVLKGFDGPETVAAYRRAATVAASLPPDPRTVIILIGLWYQKMTRLDLRGAESDAREMLRVAESLNAPDARIIGRESLAVTLFYLGEYGLAIEQAQRVLDLVVPAEVPRCIEQHGKDPRALALQTMVLCEWIMDERDSALAHRQYMNEVLTAGGHPFSLAIAQSLSYLCPWVDRDPATAAVEARKSLELAQAGGALFYCALALLYGAWGETMTGQPGGPQKIEHAFRLLNSGGGIHLFGIYSIMMAEAYAREGRGDEALAAVEAGISCADANHEYQSIADLHRTRGDMLRSMGRTEEARESYHAALEHARRQRARRFEQHAEAALQMLERECLGDPHGPDRRNARAE